MTAPIGDAGLAEAQKALLAMQIALATLGVRTVAAALTAWRQVPANKAGEVADQWMNGAVRTIMSRRAISRDLAVAYYRLARALRTGTTIPDPRNPIPKTVTMAELRSEFEQAVRQSQAGSDEVSEPDPTDTPNDRIPRPTAKERAEVPDDTEIPIDDFEGIDEDGDTEEEGIEDSAENEARVVLDAFLRSMVRMNSQIDDGLPAREVDAKRDEAHRKAGARQAAATDRIVKNGGRAKVKSLADRDPKVIGYVRFSTTGTPCGWCAMLISRGLTLYRSAESAEGKTSRAKTVKSGDAEVGDLYHDNCNCMAVPVYSKKDYKKSVEFGLNREYEKLWPKVTKNKSGKNALSAWRKYFRQAQKSGDEDTGDAQAA